MGLQRLLEQFAFFDVRKTGLISEEEIRAAFDNLQIPSSVCDRVFRLANTTNPTQIDYTEFVVLSLMLISQHLMGLLQLLFEVFAAGAAGHPQGVDQACDPQPAGRSLEL